MKLAQTDILAKIGTLEAKSTEIGLEKFHQLRDEVTHLWELLESIQGSESYFALEKRVANIEKSPAVVNSQSALLGVVSSTTVPVPVPVPVPVTGKLSDSILHDQSSLGTTAQK